MTDMNMTTRDHQILGMLAQNAEYEDIAAETNTSRGTVWRVAVKHQARKHEARIRERADERRARQLETLQALVNRTNKADVWDDIPSVRHNHPDAKFGKHPAQFPVGLAKRAIMLYTQPGELVCDPFVGSGSSHVAAIETGRAFVGADLFYEDLRARRVANAKSDDVSPLPGISDETLAVWQAEARRVEVLSSEITSDQETLLMKDVGL